MAKNMVQYLHFRILKFPLKKCCTWSFDPTPNHHVCCLNILPKYGRRCFDPYPYSSFNQLAIGKSPEPGRGPLMGHGYRKRTGLLPTAQWGNWVKNVKRGCKTPQFPINFPHLVAMRLWFPQSKVIHSCGLSVARTRMATCPWQGLAHPRIVSILDFRSQKKSPSRKPWLSSVCFSSSLGFTHIVMNIHEPWGVFNMGIRPPKWRPWPAPAPLGTPRFVSELPLSPNVAGKFPN